MNALETSISSGGMPGRVTWGAIDNFITCFVAMLRLKMWLIMN